MKADSSCFPFLLYLPSSLWSVCRPVLGHSAAKLASFVAGPDELIGPKPHRHIGLSLVFRLGSIVEIRRARRGDPFPRPARRRTAVTAFQPPDCQRAGMPLRGTLNP